MAWCARTYFGLLIAACCIAGCGNIPADPERTLERIQRDHAFHVGIVTGGSKDDAAIWQRVLGQVEVVTQTRPVTKTGELEPLLLELEAGKLDLVVGGRFDEKTPWKTRVSLGPPLRPLKASNGTTAAHIVQRNGENAWIVLVQREARAAAGQR